MAVISCGTSISRSYGINARNLAIAADARIERIELAFFDRSIDFHDKAFLAEAAETVASSRLKCASVHLNFGDEWDISLVDDAARRAAVDEAAYGIAIAPLFGADVAVVHGSDEPIGDDQRPARLACLRRSLEFLCGVAIGTRVRLALELLPRTCLGHTVDEALSIVEGLPEGTIGFCLDVNHINLREDPADAVRRLADRIITFHVSDNDGVDERHWFPFEGVIDWKSFMKAVRDIRYCGQFIFETSGSFTGDVTAYARELRARFDRLMAL